jgi:hypothetical protein
MAALPTTPQTEVTTWSPADEVERRIRAEILEPETAPVHVTSHYGLHICPSCRAPFVVPGEASDLLADQLCRLDLRCVDCGWEQTSIHSEAELEALDRELDRGYADILWALEVLWIGNEEEAIQRFSAALAAGAILPEDF